MKITSKNIFDFILIILIFSFTGTTSVFVSAYITKAFGLEKWSAGYILMFIFLILPVYHILLLGYAFIFGKFNLFYSKIKMMLIRIAGLFTRYKN